MNRNSVARFAARLIGKAPAAPATPAAPPAPPPGDSPDEWRVGDLAECIAESGDWRCRKTGYILEDGGPQFGERYRVVDVDPRLNITGLIFTRWPGLAFSAAAFRKVLPRTDEAAAGTCTTIKDLLRLPAQPVEAA
ncbi:MULTISPECIES: hypothetical protein [unclassified Novosphingobium]|uniref:hypothetical protein n=1 Tax=unclassified Novosphingobium TaxID=2644732 RepID=UPI00086F6F9C|nr:MULTISPECIES: hypothetical protein [unclassified Novosphingobium]MBN9143721.1 hypothetical protein [Novosphingobium sp.]ODU84334.1 MAG: hypothetical protein ABT10_02825 [Novosphingobium sp. SCN 63-17]OJX92874.1 MAG: hypothetical protein BGP00_23425 [Novosphingobium sp. 63-713]